MTAEHTESSQNPLLLVEPVQESDLPSNQAPSKPRRRANDLDGRDWTRWSISVWDDIRKSSDELKLGHPAIFPTMLVKRLIQCFTRSDEKTILDPFAGIGSTVVAAKELGRHGIGIELSEKFAAVAQQRLGVEQLDLFAKPGAGQGEIIRANALDLLGHVAPESVDMVITSPPYWDILDQKRTADYKDIRNYGDNHDDLGKIADYRRFLARLKEVFALVHKALRPGKYCIIVVMDLRKKDRFYPFHSDIAEFMQDLGFIYDDLIIWNRASEYNNLRPLGYPSVFRINKVHEFILIFQKPRDMITTEEQLLSDNPAESVLGTPD